MAGIKGMKHRRPRAAKSNDAAVLTLIENRLKSHALGESEMTQTQIMAARAVYDKLRPSLSSLESTVHDERDKADPQAIVTRLASLFHEKPELLDQVLALRNAAKQPEQTIEEPDSDVRH